jgi:hypothetical protein
MRYGEEFSVDQQEGQRGSVDQENERMLERVKFYSFFSSVLSNFLRKENYRIEGCRVRGMGRRRISL